ncbi:MAG TPA: hypothetical protein VHC90_07075 [Bryobacteraceae bacterium]|nr:hypothetical protein [Bryobacteraceae bacterium]
MNVGAEPKKVAILAAIVVSGVAYYFYNSSNDVTITVPTTPTAVTQAAGPRAASGRTTRAALPLNTEFRPRVMGSRPDDKVDPASINPELRLDLLAKVQTIEPGEAGRNLFQFGEPPAPPKPLAPVPTNVPKIAVNQPSGPPPSAVTHPVPAGPPQPPPIDLKYYGYVVNKADGHKEAFLLDGDNILMVSENQTVKQRYRIVKIALRTIEIEDMQGNHTQTLSLPPDAPG